jgi:2-succinyl-5-enolpyruvyl-6-hydroxy-3-cyclohexene-1-carboxylate synthase
MIHFRQGIKNIPEICFQQGVRKAIIAPGSRNAPLILAFTAYPEIECLSITDERSAAYFAVGVAQHSEEAVALVCTSGTAVLNFAPAVAEAYYQNLPLIVITADRAVETIDQADGQTIRQSNIYANYIKTCVELPVETVQHDDLIFSDRQVSQAIDIALSVPCGPVQINVPLREPIYISLPEQHSNPKIIKTIYPNVSILKESLFKLSGSWVSYTKKLLIVGVQNENASLNELVNKLAGEPDVVVIGENLSNISGRNIICRPEVFFASLLPEDKEIFKPELLITIGHSAISKQMKLYLKEFKAIEHWQFESSLPYADTYKSLTTIVPGSAIGTLEAMPLGQTKSGFASVYLHQMETISKRHNAFVENAPLSDMSVVTQLLKLVPADTVLQLANSTSVRWTQLFPTRSDLSYFCNRGTSGIDGSLSTAAGYAYSSKQPTLFLSGDLSFIYDSNGMWNNYLGGNFKVVVMNNNGGNIFKFIGDPQLMSGCETFFTTPHHVNIKSLVEAYGLNYIHCDKENELVDCINKLFASDKATVLEIFTDAELNTANYKGYFKNIKTSTSKEAV